MTVDAESEEVGELFRQLAQTGDRTVRDKLVEIHLPLAEYLARRFVNRGEILEDLVQVAALGLVKAVERFDPDRGLAFSTFATPTIMGELKRHFRDKTWVIRVPRGIQELYLELRTVVPALTQELGRSPTIAEIAEAAGVSEDAVVEATDAAQVYRLASLDVTASADERRVQQDATAGEDSTLAGLDLRLEVSSLLSYLPERERMIVYLRFYGGLSQSQIATRVGISQMHVSRLLASSLELLRYPARGRDADSR